LLGKSKIDTYTGEAICPGGIPCEHMEYRRCKIMGGKVCKYWEEVNDADEKKG
jgi:hypothetical protein